MTPEQFAKKQRAELIRAEKEAAFVLLRELEALSRSFAEILALNLTGAITLQKLYENNLLERVIREIELSIERLRNPFVRAIGTGQSRVIKSAAGGIRSFLKLEAGFFEPDRQAIQKLVGRTYDGSTLTKFFDRFKKQIADRARVELIEGFALGESNQLIAARISKVAGVARHRALTVSRTETVLAYRAAARDYYVQAGIKEYVWLSALDTRTCLVCWNLHGRKFKTSRKIFSHPNCRCVILPKVPGQLAITTGPEKFAELEPGFQKEVLGAQRFELLQQGKKFGDFVGKEKSPEFGDRFFIKSVLGLSS